MPYITDIERKQYDALLLQLCSRIMTGSSTQSMAGSINYCFTYIAKKIHLEKLSYDDINSIIGALECCKLEYYRRIAAPYEDIKIDTNGDVL